MSDTPSRSSSGHADRNTLRTRFQSAPSQAAPETPVLVKPPWYLDERRKVMDIFARATRGAPSIHHSPSGSYRLEVTPCSTGHGTWGLSLGRVFGPQRQEPIAEVHRNYDAFPFSWCEGHMNGHSYLVCGEDYQCQTVIELDTGERVDHVDPNAERGAGFCWAAHYPSADGRLIFVDGCIWAAPYELVLFDFSRPLELPYVQLRRWPLWEVKGFQDDGSFVFELTEEVRRSDDKPVRELSDLEQDELDRSPNYGSVVRDKKYRRRWRPDFTEEVNVVE